MGKDARQVAYNLLVNLASQQGYVTFDNIMDCSDAQALPIQDFDWLSNAITSRGIIVYSDAPSSSSKLDEDEYDDFAQSDYTAVYNRIIELSPSLESFVLYVNNIVPPQRQEIKQLKYQIIDGNEYARSRMIEMHLRIALKVALQRAETYDMDIEDAISYACIGLVNAVDKYDPDTSGAFSSYAALWIIQNISREQRTKRQLLYYPAHQRDNYFTMYPILKKHGCIACGELWNCDKAIALVTEKIGCTDADAKLVIEQCIPDVRIEELTYQYLCKYLDPERKNRLNDLLYAHLSPDVLATDDDTLQRIQDKACRAAVESVLHTLTSREEAVIRLRYGFDGDMQTLEQVGNTFNITRERVRQIEAKAFRKLQRHSQARRLKDFY